MLIGSDGRLNLLLGFDDSLQKVLTQTILSQEEDFRNQVFELHRLYEIQKIMMNELQLKVSDGERAYPFFGPYSKNFNYESLATQRKLTEVHTICSSMHVKNHCLQEHRGTSEHKRIPLNLEFPPNHYSNNDSEDLLFDCVATEVAAAKKQGLYNDKVSSAEVLQLSLGADSDAWQKDSAQKTCKDKAIHSSSHQSIRFEGSAFGGAKHDFESSTSYQSRKSDAFDWNSKSHLLTDGTPNILERQYLYQGVGKCHEDISCKNISARRTLFTSHEVVELDLNKVAPTDESSVDPFDHWIPDPSNCTSSVISHNEVSGYGKGTPFTVPDWRKPKNDCSTESSSALDRQDMANSTLTTSPSKDTETSLTDKNCLKISLSEKNVQKNKEDKHYSHSSNQELVEGTDSNRSPTSCKSDSITDDVLSNTKTAQQKVAPSSDMKSGPSDPKGEKLNGVDITVRAGAVSLVYLSSQCSKRHEQDSVIIIESKKRKGWCNDEREASESSSESFESIVLREQECSVDEYCVSSWGPPLLDEKDGRIKLRRGRRMKDFRKEILPSLASLSRQEICEDIKIMELAIRSREYKKYRSKTVTKTDGVSSVRARRSRRR